MFPLEITAAQAIANNIDAKYYRIIRITKNGNTEKHQEVSKIWLENGNEIKAHIYHARYGALIESIEENTKLTVKYRNRKGIDEIKASMPPGKPQRHIIPQKISNLFSQPQLPATALEEYTKITESSIMTSLVIWECFVESWNSPTVFGKSCDTYLGRHGVFEFRALAIKLAPNRRSLFHSKCRRFASMRRLRMGL